MYEAGELLNLYVKMLLACETASVYFGTFSNRFQVIFLDFLAIAASARGPVIFAVVFVCIMFFVALAGLYLAKQRRLPRINLCA